MKKTLFISLAMLPAALRIRVQDMLEVAARRSIVAWEVADGASADVVFRERLAAQEDASVSIYISDTALPHDDINLLRLDREFRLSALMDALDLAAVRVMKRREQSALSAVRAPQLPDLRYRLKHWVFLGSDRTGVTYMRVLAAMSREAVSRQWIIQKGGLNAIQADSLLAELQLRGALISEAPTPAAPARVIRPAAPQGFVARLKRWIGGSRPPELATARHAR